MRHPGLASPFEHLLDAARAGDDVAFGVLYRSVAPAVLGYLRGQGSVDPEDLTSDVFVAVVRGLADFHGDEVAFRSWVFTIAHRRLVDERRRRARRRTDPADPATLVAIGSRADGADTTTETRIVDRLDAARRLDALDDLTDAQRTVLLLRIVADLPVADVARITGREPGAVKTLQRRALAALSKDLRSTRFLIRA